MGKEIQDKALGMDALFNGRHCQVFEWKLTLLQEDFLLDVDGNDDENHG